MTLVENEKVISYGKEIAEVLSKNFDALVSNLNLKSQKMCYPFKKALTTLYLKRTK